MKKWLIPALTWLVLLMIPCALAEVRINEVMLSTAIYEKGEAYEWVELYNDGNAKVNLAGMTLTYTRKKNAQTFVFPQTQALGPGKYAVVFLTGYDQVKSSKDTYYAPIDVSKKGGTITLKDAAGKVLDEMELGEQLGDISYGRVDNTDQLRYLGTPTRGAKNAADGYNARAEAVTFSLKGGFYAEEELLIAAGEDGAEVRYTLDGSTPTETSPLWNEPIRLKKGVTVVRARAFREEMLPSVVTTQSYFVGMDRDVPVVSLVTDNKYLTEPKTGLLVKGNGQTPNYERNWEYPINVEYYTADDVQEINQMATFRVTGATSRKYGQKAISLFARSALGDKLFRFNPFENREGYEGYKAVTLRAGGTESFKTRFKDAMLVRLALGTGLYYQESVTCVAYVNGKYWGQYNLRERINKDSLAAFEGITDEATIEGVTIIKSRGQVQQGTIDEWNSLLAYMKKNDLRDPDKLKYVTDRLDVENYLTMAAFEILTGNGDIGNQRLYKFPGGKWKTLLYDLDAAMQNTKRVPLGYFTRAVNASNKLFYHEPFAALIRNSDMKDLFLTICGRLLKEKFLRSDLEAQIDAWEAKLRPLMEEQIKRWPGCSPKSMHAWDYELDAYRKVARTRPKAMVNILVSQFRLNAEQKNKYFGEFLSAE